MARYWYAYDQIGNPYISSSYRRQTTTPGCLNGPVICAIYAEAGRVNPGPLSANILQYIANGLANNVAEPSTPAGNKFYIYLKGLSI